MTGFEIHSEQSGSFDFPSSLIFGNVVPADEINRPPAKAQAALLGQMEELQATVAVTPLKLPDPLPVPATGPDLPVPPDNFDQAPPNSMGPSTRRSSRS